MDGTGKRFSGSEDWEEETWTFTIVGNGSGENNVLGNFDLANELARAAADDDGGGLLVATGVGAEPIAEDPTTNNQADQNIVITSDDDDEEISSDNSYDFPEPENNRINKLRFLLTNARSLSPKIMSLIDCFNVMS